jgi:peptidyl-prolyl cis-trans isomerase C
MKLSPKTPARRLVLFLASSLGLALAVAGAAHADPKILAKVDGVAITEEDFNDAFLDIGPGLPQTLEGPARAKYVLDYLIDLRLVAKKAEADKLDTGADFTRRMAYYHDKLARPC